MKQTALNWLIEKIHQANPSFKFDALIRQAKAMEKEQIIDTFQDSRILSITNNCSSGEQYYNETYGSEGSDAKDVILGYKTSLDAQMLDKIKLKQETLVRDYSNRSCQTCNLFNANKGGERACELELESECASYSNDKIKNALVKYFKIEL